MNLAENLLNSLPNTTYTATETASVVEEPHIVIDETRKITIPDALKKIAVTGDENVETVTFDCVRYWDENDLSSFAIYLNYVLPSGISGTYIPTSIRRATEYYSFDWNIGRPITDDSGQIEISLIAIKTDENGILQKQWGSFTNKDLTVVRGLQLQNVPEIEQETDILSQILGGLNEKVSKYDVVQTTGYSENAVMSQNAVTGCVATLDARISANSDRISANSDRITNIEAGFPSSVWHVDDTTARVKDVPENARPYAMISEIGGMTRKCENLIVPTKIATNNPTGCDIRYGDDGTSVIINGTAKAEGWISFGAVTFGNDNYVIYGGTSNCGIYIDGYTPANYIGVTSVDTSDKNSRRAVGLHIKNGATYNNTVIKPQINKGDTALPYEPYFEGLRDAKVTAVESVGANLFGGDTLADVLVTKCNGVKDKVNETVSYQPRDVSEVVLYDKFKANTRYTFFLRGYNEENGVVFANLAVEYTDGTEDALNFYEGIVYYISKADKTIKSFKGNWNTGKSVLYYSRCGVFEGNVMRENFVPYFKNTFTIPEAVQALDGYGQGVNEQYYNRILLDPTEGVKKYHQICAKRVYETGDEALENVITDGSTETVYVLDEVIEIDISDYFGDDNLIGVEGGGTLTFENEHGYDMPNTVTYMLKEVTA